MPSPTYHRHQKCVCFKFPALDPQREFCLCSWRTAQKLLPGLNYGRALSLGADTVGSMSLLGHSAAKNLGFLGGWHLRTKIWMQCSFFFFFFKSTLHPLSIPSLKNFTSLNAGNAWGREKREAEIKMIEIQDRGGEIICMKNFFASKWKKMVCNFFSLWI